MGDGAGWGAQLHLCPSPLLILQSILIQTALGGRTPRFPPFGMQDAVFPWHKLPFGLFAVCHLCNKAALILHPEPLCWVSVLNTSPWDTAFPRSCCFPVELGWTRVFVPPWGPEASVVAQMGFAKRLLPTESFILIPCPPFTASPGRTLAQWSRSHQASMGSCSGATIPDPSSGSMETNVFGLPTPCFPLLLWLGSGFPCPWSHPSAHPEHGHLLVLF